MGLNKDQVTGLLNEKLEGDPQSTFILRTVAEEEAFLKNYKDSEVEKQLGEKVSELHSRYDADILEVTGLKKEPKEKTYDFNRRLLKEMTGKIKAYEEKIKDKGEGAEPSREVEELKQLLQQVTETKDKEIGDLKQEILNYRTRAEFEKALAGLRVDPTIPEKASQALINTTISDLISISDWDGETLVFKNDKGVLRNPKTYQPVMVAEMLSERLEDILKKERTLPGQSILSRAPQQGSGGLLPGHIKTKMQLSKYLRETLNLMPNSKEYKELYAQGKELPLQ